MRIDVGSDGVDCVGIASNIEFSFDDDNFASGGAWVVAWLPIVFDPPTWEREPWTPRPS